MSALLTRDLAKTAIRLVRPSIELTMKEKIAKREHLHVVVLDLAGLILYEEPFGNKADWEHDYAKYAREKARVAFRTGLDTHAVQQRQPHLYLHGDVKYGGGVNFENIVVGASGAEWYYDEMYGYWIATTCRSLCVAGMSKVIADPNADCLPLAQI